MNKIIERMKKPTPGFFVKLRNIALSAGAVGAALLSQPAELPHIVVKLAEYLTVAGTIAGLISQTVVKDEEK